MHEQFSANLSGIGIILLAAGSSSRMGKPKQLLPVNRTTLIRKSVLVAMSANFSPVVVVLGAHKNKIYSSINDLPITIVENENWQEGMGTSVKAGMQKLQAGYPQTKAVILMLCDQPFVDIALLHSLVLEYQTSGKPVIASKYGETNGVPALFDRQFFAQLSSLQGDEGARKIIKKHAELVATVPFEKGKYDIDTMEDYQRIQQMLGQ